jgi:HK97 family phage major capsid protein
MTLKELAAARQAELDAGKAIRDKAKAEGRDLTDDELTTVEGHIQKADEHQAAFDAARKRATVLAALDDADAASRQPRPQSNATPIPRTGSDVRITGGEASEKYSTFGEFLRDVREAENPHCNPVVRQKLHAAAPGLRTDINSEGGALIPTEFSSTILRRMYTQGQILSRVRRLPITGNSIEVPYVNETSRADGSRMGGVRGYWVAETKTLTDSKPDFGRLQLKLKKVSAAGYITDEMAADYAATGSLLQDMFADELIYQIENAIVNGTGAGRPQGIANANAKVEVTIETNQTADTVWGPNIVKMWSRMYAPSRANAVWLINQDVEPYLWSLALEGRFGSASDSADAIPLYYPANGITNAGQFGILMGRPVIPVEYCDTVGDVNDIILVDLSQYLFIEKGPEAAESMHVRFLYDEMTYRVTHRVDGAIWWSSVLTPVNSSNTLAPVVTLGARA